MLLISPLAGLAAIVAAVADDASGDDRAAATAEVIAAYERGVNDRVGVVFSRVEAEHLIGGAAMLNALLRAREEHPDTSSPGPTASTGENVRVLMRLVEEVWNAGKTDVCDEIIHPTYVAHNPPQGGAEFRGAAGVKAFVELFRAGFPDVDIVVEDIFGEGEQVAWRLRWTATHTGDYMGMPPTNRRLDVAVIGVNRLVDGKVVESWGVVDHLGSMQQLGAMPSLRGAEAREAAAGALAREAA